VQAAIAACHASARTPGETDWARIVALYEALAQLAPSPVVELNRAVAVAMALGPAAGLALIDALTSEPSPRPTTSCRACAVTFSENSAALTKLARSSNALQRSRETHANAI